MRTFWQNQRFLAVALALALIFASFTPAFFTVYADEPAENPAPDPAAEAQDSANPPAEEAPAEEPAAEEPAAEEPAEDNQAAEEIDAEALADEPVDATGESGPLPDPYFDISSVTYNYSNITDAISELSGNDWTPDGDIVHVEAANFTEDVVIDGSSWTTVPTNLQLVSDGDSSDTTITGTLTIRNMLNFLLQGFTITGGLALNNNTGTLNIIDVVASNTTTDGIVVDNHDGEVILDDVEANSNAGVGAMIDNRAGADGVTITDSTFNDNNTTAAAGMQGGLQVFSDGDVLLENVDAGGNLDGDGAWVEANDITVRGGSFNNNTSPASEYGNGLFLESYGTQISLQGVEASGNEEDGAEALFWAADLENIIEIKFSKFKDNQGFGVFSDPESGSVTFKCNRFANNTLGSTLVPVGETVYYLPCPCSCDEEEKPVYLGVKLSETEPTIINPGNGTLVIIPQIVKTGEEETPRAKVLALLEKELPVELLEDETFLAGLNILLLNALLPDDAYENEEHQITIEFYIPAYKMERTFAVLFWDADAGAWEEIPFELIPHERKPGGKIVAHWPEPGIFVLVERAAEGE